MYASKVEIAFGGYVSDVCWYALLLAKLVYLAGSFGIINRGQDQVDAIQVGGFEFTIDIINLALFYPVGDLVIEALARCDNGDFCVGIEDVDNAACRDLPVGQSSTKHT